MDGARLDAWTKAFATRRSRRTLLRGLTGGALAALGLGQAAEARCPREQPIRCGEDCADLRTDPANCGRCGSACGEGDVCYAGRCLATCPSGFAPCAGTCVRACAGELAPDPAVDCACGCPDPNHPTLCGTRCFTAGACCTDTECDDGITCTVDRCEDGVCHSTPDDDRCVDESACMVGMCDVSQGGCVIVPAVDNISCGDGLRCCGGFCIDTDGDPDNCGACGERCTGDDQCLEGVCQCIPLEIDCTDRCGAVADGCGGAVPCGDCQTGHECDDTNICVDTCDATTCADGCCSEGTCVTPTGDTACGANGSVCVDCLANGEICHDGACEPCSGTTFCDATLGEEVVCHLTVPSGEFCTLEGTTILGNLQIQANARLLAEDITAFGSVLALDNHAGIRVGNAIIHGEVFVTSGNGGECQLSSTTVDGDVTFGGNEEMDIVIVQNVTTDGDLTVSGNRAPDESTGVIGVLSNTVGGDLNFFNNSAGSMTLVSGNTITGELGCGANDPEPANAGQVNTAGSKSGQCAAL